MRPKRQSAVKVDLFAFGSVRDVLSQGNEDIAIEEGIEQRLDVCLQATLGVFDDGREKLRIGTFIPMIVVPVLYCLFFKVASPKA